MVGALEGLDFPISPDFWEPREGPENLGSRVSWRSKTMNPSNNDCWVERKLEEVRKKVASVVLVALVVLV